MSDSINNDELAAFVTSTLNAISVGVADAVEFGETKFDIASQIEFEVAVTATKAKEGGGGLKIQVFSADAKLSSENQHISRIKFSIQKVHKTNYRGLDRSHLTKGIV